MTVQGTIYEADVTEQDITFWAEVQECKLEDDGEWDGEDVHKLTNLDGSVVDLQEMAKHDPDPFFVILTILKEGWGTGKPSKKWYLPKAIHSSAKLCLGKLGFKGHQEPERRAWEYRNPEMRIVKSKVDRVIIDGVPRLVARAKGYVSRVSQDLRTHIGEGLAGPVSIDGRAVLRKGGDRLEVVDMIEIRSIDFCNPGTNGIDGMGVEEVVSEMADDTSHRTRSSNMTERLNMTQMQVEYEAEISEITRRATETATEPLNAKITEYETEVSELKTGGEQKDAKIKKLETKVTEQETEITEMKTEVEKSKTDVKLRLLGDYVDAEITEMEVSDYVGEKLKARCKCELVDNDDADLTKSKVAVKKQLDIELADVKEMIEKTGGSMLGRTTPPASAGGNPARGSQQQRSSGGESMADQLGSLIMCGPQATED